ncbi:hypothetical protein AnigIFM60653_009250 [Aspergillus niger]|nr:hypothetical protein AnigIFM60653_009250 [Aspergillus niger]GLA19843.1 hypothetical protein AnigIFM62618_007967 [Aspergillus niger]
MDEKAWCIGASDGPVDSSEEGIGKVFGGTEEIEKYVEEGKASARFLGLDPLDLREEHWDLETEEDSVWGEDSVGLHIPVGSDTYTRSQLGQGRVIFSGVLSTISLDRPDLWVDLRV